MDFVITDQLLPDILIFIHVRIKCNRVQQCISYLYSLAYDSFSREVLYYALIKFAYQ